MTAVALRERQVRVVLRPSTIKRLAFSLEGR